jgi:WD repeat-containing protein 68
VRVFDLRDGCRRAAVLFELPREEEEEVVEEEAGAAATTTAGPAAADKQATAPEPAGSDDEDDEDEDEDEDEDDDEPQQQQQAAGDNGATAPFPARRKRRRRRLNPAIAHLAWSPADPRYLACVPQASPAALVLDIRFPAPAGRPLATLCRHRAAVNAVAWSPADAAALVTAGDDAQALIWDLSGVGGCSGGVAGGAGRGDAGGGAGGGSKGGMRAGGSLLGAAVAGGAGAGDGGPPQEKQGDARGSTDPILTWVGDAEVASLRWSAAQPDWIALACGSRAQIMLV